MIDRRKYKGMDILKVGLQSIKMELHWFEDYIDVTSKSLQNSQRELEDDYQKAKEKVSEDDSDLDMYFSDDFHKYHELFPAFTYNSMLVTVFSFFESRLKFICELYQRKQYSNVRLNDLNGSEIEKCKRYLILIAQLDFVSFEDNWRRITNMQKLRNAIIHHSSKIPDEKGNANIVSMLKADNRIEYIKQYGDFYIKDVSFIKEFSNILISFFTNLVEKLAIKNVIAHNTSMPFNNVAWGQEKTERLLKSIITGIELLKRYEKTSGESIDKDLCQNLKSMLSMMAWDTTKLYAFFFDAEWDTKDREVILDKGDEGLNYLKQIYRAH